MIVTIPGKYYISVNQESKRCYAENEGYKYSHTKLVVAKGQGIYLKYMGASAQTDREMFVETLLDAGEYIIYSKCEWVDRKTRQQTISAYGKGKAVFQPL